MYIYPNITVMSDPKAPTALSNAIADVLSLPHSAVSINSFNSFGYLGGTSIGYQSNPSTKVTLTVLYQGTALTTSDISSAFNIAISAFNDYANNNWRGVNNLNISPLGIALRNNDFPNAANVNFATVQTMSSSQYPLPTSPPSVNIPINAGESVASGLGALVVMSCHVIARSFYRFIVPCCCPCP